MKVNFLNELKSIEKLQYYWFLTLFSISHF